MLVEPLVDRAVVAGCFDGSFTASVFLGEFRETIVWQANLVLQVAVVATTATCEYRLWVSIPRYIERLCWG